MKLLLLSCLAAHAASTEPVRGVHLTAWVAGTSEMRTRFLDNLTGTSVNAVIVPIKEFDGQVYMPVPLADALGTVRRAIPRPAELVAALHARGLRAIARQVVFKDNILPHKKPEWAVQDAAGGVWKNRGGFVWVDPYLREVWDYNVAIASAARAAGFDEVQFDYIRFPTEGDISRCRYAEPNHSSATAQKATADFVAYARERLAPLGMEVGIAVFGLTTSQGGMGIGQNLAAMAAAVDHVSPMMYPSHYAKGEYGVDDPDAAPYQIIRYGLRDAKRALGADARKLRPYLQDFSLGRRYGVAEVRAQIRAAAEHGVHDWILWNPVNRYTWAALRPDAPQSAPTPPAAPPRLP